MWVRVAYTQAKTVTVTTAQNNQHKTESVIGQLIRSIVTQLNVWSEMIILQQPDFYKCYVQSTHQPGPEICLT